jgi:ABC-type multidrug transport system fused ATPase/permease subunit
MKIYQSYFFFLKNISRKDKYKLFLLTACSLFLAVFEFLSIILIYPFIISLQNIQRSDLDPDVVKIYAIRDYFDLTNDEFVKILLFLIIFFFIIFNFINLIILYRFSYFWSQIIGKLQAKVFHYYTNLQYNQLLHVNTTLIVKNIIYEVKRFISMFISPVSTILNKVFSVLIIIIAVTYIEPNISLILFGTLLIYYLTVYQFLKKVAKKNSLALSDKFQSILKHVDETVGNFQFLKISNLITRENQKFRTNTSDINNLDAKNDIISILPKSFLEILFFIIGLFVLYYLIGNNLIFLYLAKVALVFIVFIKVTPSFQLMYSLFISIKGHYSCVEALLEPLGSEFNSKKKDSEHELSIYKISSISIQKLSFNFSTNQSKKIIKNFSCEFFSNSIFAIQGPSGSGKSTLLNILLGLEKNYEGKILVNNIDLKSVSLNSWHKNITYVPQNIYLFDGTLKDNITFAEKDCDIDYNKLNRSIENAGLVNFVKNLDQGINSAIKNNAKLISGGEKQRIALARALYKESALVLLDEPINNLDKDNADIFKSTLQNIKKDRIIILVAHQPEIVNFCDKIYNL